MNISWRKQLKQLPVAGPAEQSSPPLEGIVARNHRQLITFSGPLSISLIAQYIDKGMPIMWGMSAIGPFEEMGLQANRMEGVSSEDWSEKLKNAA